MKFWQRNKSIPVSVSLVSPFKPGFFNKRRLLYISFLAFLLGGAISYIAHLLILLINLVTNISFYGIFSAIPASPAGNTLGLFVILIPAIGGLVVGILALYGSKAIRGHGIPEAMEKILTNQSKIPPAITYLKPVATAISIGTGGPFGAEGPIIATGGALGSTLGQLLKITHNERKILLASGATAGMAAIFGTPIAAIFLAIELLLFEFSPRSIIPVAIACITGAAGNHVFFGAEPVFFMNVKIEAASTEALLFYGILGLIFGILSILVTKCVYFIEDLFEKLPLHWMWWPAIGGLFVGLIGYFAPQTLGVGYNNISDLLNEELTVKVLGSLFILKFLSWSISLGSGTAGGTLAPLLTIGGAAGALCGICINSYFPEAGVPVHVAALVGMSAMFAGASRALLTSIIFALETTNQANALLPLLAACAGAYIVSFFLMENTIMTEKIARRGIKTPDSFEPDPLENILISEVLQKEDDILISENNTIGELREWLSKIATIKNYYIVTDDSGKYKGIISSLDVMNYTNSNESGIEGLLRTNISTVSENLTLRLAAEKMDSLGIDFLPVLCERNRKIAGLITSSQIIEAYSSRNADHTKNHPSISLKRRGMEIIIHGRNFFEKRNRGSEI